MKLDDQELIYVQEIEKRMSNYIKNVYCKGNVKRDAHPKTIGIVEGVFKINEKLPDYLKIGLFSTVKGYPTIVRFSNANHKIQSDAKKDIRGISIRVLNIDTTERNEIHQDFLLMSHPTMPFGTLKKFRDVIVNTVDTSFLKKLLWLLTNFKTFLKSTNAKQVHTDVSSISYWSTSTFKFGEQVVKYKLTPTVSLNKQYPIDKSENFLENRLKAELKTQPIVFDFCVQFYQNEHTTPTTDMSFEWNEKQAPFIKLATLTLPKQKVVNNQTLDNSLTFSLNNSLKEHLPTGKLNLARIAVYKTLSTLRHQLNN